jgi:tetratricopeptide (TPR) repeat protein
MNAQTTDFETTLARALEFHRAGQNETAAHYYERAICQRPDQPTAFSLLPLASSRLTIELALRYGRRSVRIEPSSSTYRTNLANQLNQINNSAQAAQQYCLAVILDPTLADSYYNFAVMLATRGGFTQALPLYQRCLAIKPNWLQAKSNLAFVLLALDRYQEAWPLYETRFLHHDYRSGLEQDLPFPHWDGRESLSGKRILLWAEQGLGDAIQFCRFAINLVNQGNVDVGLLVRAPLAELMKAISPALRIHINIPTANEYDLHFPLMSLARVANAQIDTIPFSKSAYLYSTKTLKEKWSRLIPQRKTALVGIVWKSGAVSKITGRSVELETFSRLSNLDIQFVCLQKEISHEEKALIESLTNFYIPVGTQADLADTAAIIDQLDLVISVDTSVAHLSGAMGKPTWVLLPKVADWRWSTNRMDSAWYPNVTLFRQERQGDWGGLLDRVHCQLTTTF